MFFAKPKAYDRVTSGCAQNGTLRSALVHIVDTRVPIFLTRTTPPNLEKLDFPLFWVWFGNCYTKGVTKTLQVPGETIAPRFAVLPTESPRIEICPIPL